MVTHVLEGWISGFHDVLTWGMQVISFTSRLHKRSRCHVSGMTLGCALCGG